MDRFLDHKNPNREWVPPDFLIAPSWTCEASEFDESDEDQDDCDRDADMQTDVTYPQLPDFEVKPSSRVDVNSASKHKHYEANTNRNADRMDFDLYPPLPKVGTYLPLVDGGAPRGFLLPEETNPEVAPKSKDKHGFAQMSNFSGNSDDGFGRMFKGNMVSDTSSDTKAAQMQVPKRSCHIYPELPDAYQDEMRRSRVAEQKFSTAKAGIKPALVKPGKLARGRRPGELSTASKKLKKVSFAAHSSTNTFDKNAPVALTDTM